MIQQVYARALNSQNMNVCMVFVDVAFCYLISLDTKKSADSCHRTCYLSSSPHPAKRMFIFCVEIRAVEEFSPLLAVLIIYLLELCLVHLSHITNHRVQLTVFLGIHIIPVKLYLVVYLQYPFTHHNALIIISCTSQNNLFLLRLTSLNAHSFPYDTVKLHLLTFYFEDSKVRSAVKSTQCIAGTVHPETLENPSCSDNR